MPRPAEGDKEYTEPWVAKAPVSEEIRRAISAHIEAKKQDKEFQSRLRAGLQRNEAILRKLAQ